MSRLEGEAKPFLQPMLIGEKYTLSPMDQAIIAAWGVKTAMVLEGINKSDQCFYSQAEREAFRALSVIPQRTSVWLATSADPSYFFTTKNRHLSSTGATEGSGVSITIVLAHLVLQVLTINVLPNVGLDTRVTGSVKCGPWDKVAVQIWPHQEQIDWPLPLGLNGKSGLDLFADRFNVAALPDDEIELINV
jgi:hypothetical protein